MKFLKAFTICNLEIGIRRNRDFDSLSSESLAPTGFIELQMIHGEGTRKAACEDVSLDRFDSLPALKVSSFNDGDVSSPSSRYYSSCGESDFERYCSANSVLGTPSVCSTITVFHDFTDYDQSDLENFNLSDGVDITTKDLRLSSTGSSSRMPFSRTGIRSDDNDDVPAAPMLGASGFMGTNQLDNNFDQSSIRKRQSLENHELIVPSSNCEMRKTLDNSSTSPKLCKKSLVILSKMKDFEQHELNGDVHEMEEILLDSIDSAGSRRGQGNRLLEPQLLKPLRDGGLTASTSATDGACLPVQPPMRLDRVEVVGARQKKGDVSFSKRLVGIKEYTVYKIKVWSGNEHWVIERRYRDFLNLYHCMKTLSTEKNWDLPSPWYAVEKETKKIFGMASPEVILQRSILLQKCLQSILHIRLFSSPPRALIWFLSPPSALMSDSSCTSVTIKRNYSSLGKALPLIVEIPPCKSIEQMLAEQHNCCAGCHRHFDDGTTSIWDFLQTFGRGKPRLCEYTAKLFCSSCHTNETSVLPARVLHHWDFTHYPVSQLAKSYLDSINDQPLLSVTSVNPILLSKVPALLHVTGVRKKIGTMLPFVLCPFRRSISSALGVRRYLLENNDFFSLRDLIDLSKGAFAALPGKLETVSRKILKHITDQCSICCDVGVPCSARQDCCNPCSLIFPFQEDEIERCTTCQSVFHKPCFRKILSCSCGARLNISNGVRPVSDW
ncbi:hypothetical protein K1719_030422 [Acacia pycnantha]|nr:hypothetical protein K1719_030422 [Acacia pycnantha]